MIQDMKSTNPVNNIVDADAKCTITSHKDINKHEYFIVTLKMSNLSHLHNFLGSISFRIFLIHQVNYLKISQNSHANSVIILYKKMKLFLNVFAEFSSGNKKALYLLSCVKCKHISNEVTRSNIG